MATENETVQPVSTFTQARVPYCVKHADGCGCEHCELAAAVTAARILTVLQSTQNTEAGDDGG